MVRKLTPLAVLSLVGCSDPDFEAVSCKDVDGECVQVASDEPDALFEAANTVSADTTIVLGLGTFTLDDQVTLRTDGVTLIGQGMDDTTLDFGGQAAQTNGVDAVGIGLTFEGFTVLDAKKDGIRVEDSDRVVFRGVRATWTNEDDPTNGAYGLYPVKSSNVLIEGSEALNASDAGLYVGQCQHVIVRDSYASGNVAGLEIENTQYADVYGNTVEDNTGGLLVFDLPGNPIVGRDIKVHDNTIVNNNRPNFAPSGTVRVIPAGTGTILLASRRVEFTGNTYTDNGTVDIAILSGLVIESDDTQWALTAADVVGTFDDLGLLTDGTTLWNFRTEEILVHDNTHEGGGTLVDAGAVDQDCLLDPSSDACTRPMGVLITVTYGSTPVDSVLYDAIGESSFSTSVAGDNSNDNHICMGASTEATFASLNLGALSEVSLPTLSMLYRPDSPFAPFDCDTLTLGAIADVTVEAP